MSKKTVKFDMRRNETFVVPLGGREMEPALVARQEARRQTEEAEAIARAEYEAQMVYERALAEAFFAVQAEEALLRQQKKKKSERWADME